MMDCTMGTSTEWDELKSHVDGRFVSAPDALWRIFGKSLQGRSHTVVNLHVHEEKNKAPLEDAVDDEDEVPDENEPSNEVESADVFVEEPEFGPAEDGAEEDKGTSSTLLAWFKLNAEDPRARDYYYYEIPEHFRWRKDKGVFVARKVNWNVIGRIHCVGHVTSELYHLRVLLLHVKGATSYKDLMHYDGVDHDTYGAACVARKLTYDDTEWDKCLAEAVEWRMPGQLRWLFASILAHCNPKFPEELLDKYMVSALVAANSIKRSRGLGAYVRRLRFPRRTGRATSSEEGIRQNRHVSSRNGKESKGLSFAAGFRQHQLGQDRS